MIQRVLDGEYPGYELLHQRMAFSREMEEVGNFHPRKVVELVRVIFGILRFRVQRRPRVLYYPPAGPRAVPVLRDLAILAITRPFFQRTIFHFHAGGVGRFVAESPTPVRPLLRLAYGRADAGIRVSGHAPPDPSQLGAAREFILPNAVEDHAGSQRRSRRGEGPAEILYVGLLSEAKGIEVLLRAADALGESGRDYRLRLVGPFESPQYRQHVESFIASCDLGERVVIAGELTGADKWAAYGDADVFCFPTHHPSETFGIVLLEALSFSLPVVATRWRGTVDIVEDGRNGFLVPTRDPAALAARLEELVADPGLRVRMGAEGRQRYEEQFTLVKYHEGLQRVFDAVVHRDAGVDAGG